MQVNVIDIHTKVTGEAELIDVLVIKQELQVDDVREDEVVPLKSLRNPVICLHYGIVIVQELVFDVLHLLCQDTQFPVNSIVVNLMGREVDIDGLVILEVPLFHISLDVVTQDRSLPQIKCLNHLGLGHDVLNKIICPVTRGHIEV